MLNSLLRALEQTPYKWYLLIDEYDKLANEIAMGSTQPLSQERDQELLQGEGILKTVKAAAAGRGWDRVFIHRRLSSGAWRCHQRL